MAVSLKSKFHIDSSQLPSALAEIRCGSYDGYVQGLGILGDGLKYTYPDIYELPQQWKSLRGADRIQLLMQQKKACLILSALIEDPKTDIDNDVHLRNRLSSLEFLTAKSVQFGHKLTKEVYHRIQDPLRERLDSGDETFSQDQQTEFEERLSAAQGKLISRNYQFELPSPPSDTTLPPSAERSTYWKSVSGLLRSREGHIGVFYIHSPHLAQDLVLKAPLRPVQELFASRILQKLEFLTPDTCVVDRASQEGLEIERALERFPEFCDHCNDIRFKRFFLMNRVYGRSIEEIDETTAAHAFTNDKISLTAFLEQIGKLAAADTLMHYQDRLPHIGVTNWGNLMCIERNGRLSFTVAIDQSVDISRSSVFMPSEKKLARVVSIATDVLTDSTAISQAAKDLWEEIPGHFKSYISEEEALAVLQQGLVKGFTNISRKLTPEVLRGIDAELRPLYTDEDSVEVESLIAARNAIAERTI